MANKRNFQRELEDILALTDRENKPTLLLHCCCAPCSSYVLEYLKDYFKITCLFYNPNISPLQEYLFRKEELLRYINTAHKGENIPVLDCDYDSDLFYTAAKGLENAPEGGERCRQCFTLRLKKTVELADKKYDYVATTLTISPLKNAQLLNQIGEELCCDKSVCWLPSDFKKRGGYQRSIQLSKEHQLYRQNYCGCIFSKLQK